MQCHQQSVEIVGLVGNVRQDRVDQEPGRSLAPNSGAPSRAQYLMKLY